MIMSGKQRDFDFSDRAVSYDEGLAGRFSKRFYTLVQNEVKLNAGMRVLDVGCGTGALLDRLRSVYNIEAHGIDAEAEMIAVAQQKRPECLFKKAPGEQIPYTDQSMDAIITCMAYHHFADKTGFAREAARVLKPGGVLYIADPKFPLVVRKPLNGALRLFRIAGEFLTAREIAGRFAGHGFEFTGAEYDGYAQIVKLTRN